MSLDGNKGAPLAAMPGRGGMAITAYGPGWRHVADPVRK